MTLYLAIDVSLDARPQTECSMATVTTHFMTHFTHA
jgi:hypothetical protein